METQRSNRRILVGLFVIVIGLLILLRNFNLIPDFIGDYIFIWPSILIGVGLLMLTNAANRTAGLIVLAVGGFFWINRVFSVVNFWEIFIPSLIILVGVLMVFRHKIDKDSFRRPSGDFLGPEFIDDVSIFSGSEKVVESSSFKGGRVTSIFGGSTINLLGCELAPGNNVIDVFTVFGGSTFIVPSDWNVKLDVISIFGGYGDKRSANLNPNPVEGRTIIIKGIVIFGGGEIKSIRTK